jgi:hydrogenase-1 operon protein HyaE
MTLELAPGPTSLDRLETAIGRMQQKHGFQRVDRAPEEVPLGCSLPEFDGELTALLLTEDPQRNLEVLDACVMLPEVLKPLGTDIERWVAGPDAAPALMRKFGVARAPAVVFLRQGNYLGVLNGIRDWGEYQQEIGRLLTGPAQSKPIGIPVRTANTAGACA